MWWQLNLDPSGLITLDTAPCWVSQPTLGTAPQPDQGPQLVLQAVPAPSPAPLDNSSTAKELNPHASHESQLAVPFQFTKRAASSGVPGCRQTPLAEAAQAASAVAGESGEVAEDRPRLEQERRPRQEQPQLQPQQQWQPEQQWRDHWKQCWAPLRPHFRVGK